MSNKDDGECVAMSGSGDEKISCSSSSTCVSVDDVHDRLDSLMLSVFDAVLGHTAVSITPDGNTNIDTLRAEKVQKIRSEYSIAVDGIENLVGIDRTEDEQQQILAQQSQDISALKEKIMLFEAQMLQKKREIDVALNSALSDQVLGLGQ